MNSILEEAKKIRQERQTQYDVPENNFRRIADLWNAYLKNRERAVSGQGLPLDEADIARMMILFKISRDMWEYKYDNAVDIAGYADCLAQVQGEYEH